MMVFVAVFSAAVGYWIAMCQHAKRTDRAIAKLDTLRETIARERLLRRLGEPEPLK
ncbi:hypothetical protein [Luteibacter yeojuensis]|uniref:Uncharacterized protein n=1 Tax=Luteibacter yeojuensis TaxID=345309 RepID=A0A7X5TNV3_9GAMM|nr:hypothetical protein [Luteibacter yeojuensis]NID14360.1 hypothetical protein [Luteibacter yeojuensis]